MTNSRGDAFKAIVEKISARGDTYAYFFESLNDPTWLKPLAEAGFFKDPFGIEELEGGLVRFPAWPESRVLARLAQSDENEVLRLIMECRETDNPRVHDDFVEAANRMSPQAGARLVPKIIEWLTGPYQLLLPLRAGELLERLATGAETEAAMTLARSLLKLSEAETDAGGLGTGREVVPQFDQSEYKTILENNVPGFVTGTGLRGVSMLSDLLEEALSVEAASLGGPPADASYIWRPSIIDHEQNHEWEPHDYLVTAIRDSADLILAREDAPPADVVDLFATRGWHVFDRLAMYVAVKWSSMDHRPAIALMMRKDLFASYEVSYEYAALVTAAFHEAAPAEQLKWLTWIDEGPDLTQYAKRIYADTGMPPSPDDLATMSDRWRWERLAYVPDEVLDADWLGRKRRLADQMGEPSSFPFLTYTPTGSVSPLSIDQARELTPGDLANFARDIPASADRFASPEEGYAGILQIVAQEQPSKMSSGLSAFIGQRPVYVRSVLNGLERAAAEGASDIDWLAVISLIEWVMLQPREIPGGSGGTYSDIDPGWVWTRSSIADLIEEGLKNETIPFQLRERTWALLEELILDPDAGGSIGLDAATDSLNHIRGKAMHDIFLYARWVSNALRDDQGEKAGAPALETLMPEVGQLLDAHLDAQVDPSPSVRAVYGMRFQLLVYLDPDWASSRADQIFSTDSSGFDALGGAAWRSYVKYGGRHLRVMELLRPQYQTFVRYLDPQQNDVPEDDKFVVDHIMTLYWYGHLGDEPSREGLVSSLFEGGGPGIRHRALEYIGRSLRDVQGGVPSDVAKRLMRLWEYRLAALAAPATARTEIKAFGWWMESAALDAGWRVRQLLEVLRLAGSVDADFLVVRALATLGDEQLQDALRSLILIIGADTDGWGVHGWKDPAYELIRRGMSSSDPTSIQLATDAGNLLISRGLHEFRPLLSSQS